MEIEKILKELKVGPKNKVKLVKKTQWVEIWWETRDKWFLNIKTKKDKEPMWIIEPDAITHFNFLYPDYKLKK